LDMLDEMSANKTGYTGYQYIQNKPLCIVITYCPDYSIFVVEQQRWRRCLLLLLYL